MKKILIVVGTRPNFIKTTQFKRIAQDQFPGRFEINIVHTGQHYDNKMAKVFFNQFDLIPGQSRQSGMEEPHEEF